MTYTYRPRGMPARYMQEAPEIVRRNVLDLIQIIPAAPLDFDVILRAPITDVETGEVYGFNGVDFGKHGARGCHFFLSARGECRAYRERNRRKRIAWHDLPADTRAAILSYLTEE